MTQIGQLLADEAARRGWSHETAGEYHGVSQATFSRWCSGENIPAYRYWSKMARFLRMTKDEVGEIVTAQRAERGNRGQADRLDELERQVEALRVVMLRIAERLGVDP